MMAILYDEKEFDIHKTVLIEYLGDKKEVIVPEGVTELYNGAFPKHVERIVCPDSVKYITIGAFEYCKNLKSLVVNKKFIWQAYDTNDWNAEVKVYNVMGPYDEEGDDEIAAEQLSSWSKDYEIMATPTKEKLPYDLFIQ